MGGSIYSRSGALGTCGDHLVIAKLSSILISSVSSVALHPLPPHPLETTMVPSPGSPPSFGWQWARPALPSIDTIEDKIEAFHWNTRKALLQGELSGTTTAFVGKSSIDALQPPPRRRPVQDEAVQDDNDHTEANASTDATRQTRRPITNQQRRDEEANPQDEEKKLHPQDSVACVLCNRSTTRCDDVTEQAYEEAHEESRLRSTIPHPR